ncbi:phosphatidylinositol-glycan biosynthesis class S protein-domain-containing protein [Daedaleopsis nitida]|nr:phosphatidylinositol-glycan biosynthesis class S protein-domain-containing protein [Daedaleopsis nitida]
MDSSHLDPARLCFESDRTRRYIISSYWLVILLAIPLWWQTTSIDRLALPASRVQAERQREVLFPVTVNLEGKDGEDASHTARMVQSWLQLGEDAALENAINITVTAGNLSDAAYQVILDRGERNPVVDGRRLYFDMLPEMDMFGGVDTLSQDVSLGRLADTLTKLLVPYGTYAASNERAQRVMTYSPRYRLAFTLLNEDAASGNAALSWEVQDAIQRHIVPMLNKLSVLHNFTIESQVQYHAPLAFEPRSLEHEGQQAYGLTHEDLTVFVNSAEWTLSSSASNDPVIHFVLFIPSSKNSPLHILDYEGSVNPSNAFLLPQWGGIVLLNPSHQSTSTPNPLPKLSTTDLDPIFNTFAYQLIALLGVPGLPRSIEEMPPPESAPREPFTEWELDALLRKRALENVRGSKETLHSIIRLVDQIEGMPVGPDVRDDIEDALAALKEVHETSLSSPTAALKSSARALTLSSRAFFNPGMLALLYFPTEHKYAVYTPLFASIVAPLFGAIIREMMAWRRARRAAREEAQKSGDSAESSKDR